MPRMKRNRAVFLLFLVACAASENNRNFGEDPSSSGGFKNDASAPTGSCSDAAKLVYVLSDDDDLHSFNPDTLTFKKIGRLSCSGVSPNSMAVDRSGTAWVNTQDGGLYRVSTNDASCSPTNYAKGQNGFVRMGMAFASNAAGSDQETLFVSGIDEVFGGKGLATIDLAALTLKPIANYPGALARQGAELTGTGEGKLYGFFTTQPDATLAQIEKSNAATSEDKALRGVSTGTAWAFSFWGGDFWFYTSSGGPSRVTRLKASSDSSIAVVVDDVGGFRIVGAGVSTCAPTTPPR
jgi:hypothetical protein